MRAMLDEVGFSGHLEDRVSSLSVAQKHLLELAKALVVSPRLLILDEPTAPLGQESVEMLFEQGACRRRLRASVVYITHRLAEVREIADRVTVLRDGESRGTADVDDVTDDELLALIVGRHLDSTFPPKHEPTVRRGRGLADRSAERATASRTISLSAHRGEIVGVAGIVGNGQSAFLRALAGLDAHAGTVMIADKPFTAKQLRAQLGVHARRPSPPRV